MGGVQRGTMKFGLFGRRELLITLDMGIQAEARKLLSKNNIAYKVKTYNRDHHRRAKPGDFVAGTVNTIEYTFFVRKADYDRAKVLLDAKLERRAGL